MHTGSTVMTIADMRACALCVRRSAASAARPRNVAAVRLSGSAAGPPWAAQARITVSATSRCAGQRSIAHASRNGAPRCTAKRIASTVVAQRSGGFDLADRRRQGRTAADRPGETVAPCGDVLGRRRAAGGAGPESNRSAVRRRSRSGDRSRSSTSGSEERYGQRRGGRSRTRSPIRTTSNQTRMVVIVDLAATCRRPCRRRSADVRRVRRRTRSPRPRRRSVVLRRMCGGGGSRCRSSG